MPTSLQRGASVPRRSRAAGAQPVPGLTVTAPTHFWLARSARLEAPAGLALLRPGEELVTADAQPDDGVSPALRS